MTVLVYKRKELGIILNLWGSIPRCKVSSVNLRCDNYDSRGRIGPRWGFDFLHCNM